MNERRIAKVIAAVSFALSVSLGGYFGTYYVTLSPLPVRPEGEPSRPFYDLRASPYGEFHRRYATFFSAAHWIDRRLRPHHWESK